MDLILKTLAERLVFGKIKNKEELLKEIDGQWEFRKGKDIADVNKAIRKGRKAGLGKFEREIEWIELYLGDVFKKGLGGLKL